MHAVSLLCADAELFVSSLAIVAATVADYNYLLNEY